MAITQPGGAIRIVGTGAYAAMRFSPDGRRLYLVSGTTVSVVNAAAGTVAATYDLGSRLGGLDISPDGRYLAVAVFAGTGAVALPGNGTSTVVRIDLSNGATTTYTHRLVQESAFTDVAFMADGSLLLQQEVRTERLRNSGQLERLDFATGQFTVVSAGEASRIPAGGSLSGSRDGRSALLNPLGMAYYYDAATGIVSRSNTADAATPYAPTGGISAISPNGNLIALGSSSQVVDKALNPVADLGKLHPGPVIDLRGLAFSADGRTLYVLNGAGQVAGFDTISWAQTASYFVAIQPADVYAKINYGDTLQVSDDGRFLSVITSAGVQLIDLSVAVQVPGIGDALTSSTATFYGSENDDLLVSNLQGRNLQGGPGNDSYYADFIYNIVEQPGEGYDTIYTSYTSYTLPANVEKLVLAELASYPNGYSASGTGNALDNVIVGNGGFNLLHGGGGRDTLIGAGGRDTLWDDGGASILDGGADDDTYYVDNAGSTVIEASGGGTDIVYASVDYTLTSEVENLIAYGNGARVLTGNGLGNLITGGTGNDTLYGLGGNDTLNGGAGADTMIGGMGDDVYLVDDAGDVVTELTGEGSDEVRTTLSAYTLAANVERLTYTGSGAVTLAGNAGDNFVVLAGAGARGLIDLSAGGDDRATGGVLNDSFFLGGALTAVDRIDGGPGSNDQVGIQGDYATDPLVVGTDTFRNVEVLAALPGTTGLNRYVISLNDATTAAGGTFTVYGAQLRVGEDFTVNGSAETDARLVMYGGAGTDTLIGGAGADRFLFGPGKWSGLDSVVGGGGDDQLVLDGTYVGLSVDGRMDVETLVLLPGPAGDRGRYMLTVSDSWSGNGETKTILATDVATDLSVDARPLMSGGSIRVLAGTGNDAIAAGSGNDYLFGGMGADTLTGGTGRDTFAYDNVGQSTGMNFDTLTDFSIGTDVIQISGQIHDSYAAKDGGRLDAGSFDVDLQAATAGLLSGGAAVFFTPDSGSLAGRTFLIVDADGIVGYQTGGDYVFELPAGSATQASGTDFIIA